jgi:hypothetical protein
MAFTTGGRKCKFESLENRQMMAGDVVGSIHGGTLVLKGDGFNNGITINAGAVPNSIEVTGFTPTGGTPTNVNGLTNTTVTFLNVIHGLTIKMNGGNDEVTIDGVNINGLTNINMGTGVDTLLINDSTMCKGLTINTAQDADTVTITDTTVQGKTKIDTGADCDHVTLQDSVFGELNLNLGKDNDELVTDHITVTTRTKLDGGLGINVFDEGISDFFGARYDKFRLAGGGTFSV